MVFSHYGANSRIAAALIAAVVATSAFPLTAHGTYDPKHGRWLQRDPIGTTVAVGVSEPQGSDRSEVDVQVQYRDGANVHQYVRSRPGVGLDPDGLEWRRTYGPQGKWRRRIIGRPPSLLGNAIGYDVEIRHTISVPEARPQNATQVWQVVSCVTMMLMANGKSSAKVVNIKDIMPLDKEDKETEDTFSWTPQYDGKPCFAMEYCIYTIGFDNGHREREAASEEIGPNAAMLLLKKMRGPKDTYSSTYTFFKKANCCAALHKIAAWAHWPDGETLEIQGVGRWPTK